MLPTWFEHLADAHLMHLLPDCSKSSITKEADAMICIELCQDDSRQQSDGLGLSGNGKVDGIGNISQVRRDAAWHWEG